MAHDHDLVIRNALIVDGSGEGSFEGDVAVRDGRISRVAKTVAGTGREEVDARGLVLTPGFVDVHTHYDGQATWSPRFTPSSYNGVTTVIMGNCGVGFAPCREHERDHLIHLMEGIEDIPYTVLDEGLPWTWETFPEYLDALEALPHDINFGAYVPHAALRVYVMGERALKREPSTEADRTAMARLLKEALAAGAQGFGSSQSLYHRSSEGEITPTVGAGEEEYMALMMALRDAGHGLMQILADPEEMSGTFERLMRASGRPLTFTLIQGQDGSDRARRVMGWIESMTAEGLRVKAQVLPRPIGLMLSHSLSLTPFSCAPTAHALHRLPLEARMAELRNPEVRARIVAEYSCPVSELSTYGMHCRDFEVMFPLQEPLDYEPKPAASIAAMARRRGIPPEELAYDMMLEENGRSMLFMTPGNYPNCSLDFVVDASRHKDAIVGLGDGGAHLGMLCDATYTTTMMMQWPKDRPEGMRLDLPRTVHALSRKTAELVGLLDRGLIAPGMRADLNLIDLDRLALRRPEIVIDLPAGGRRLHQRADGYVATYVNGEAIQREGVATEALPGRLVRGAQAAPRQAVLQSAE